MKKYICTVCGYVYDPASGDPDSGIAPGTAFEIFRGLGVPCLRCRQGHVRACGVGGEDLRRTRRRLRASVFVFGR
jgi:hypothetical protein